MGCARPASTPVKGVTKMARPIANGDVMRDNSSAEPRQQQDQPAQAAPAPKAVPMPTLEIRLLGEFAAFYGGAPLTAINSHRLQGLLAYLLLHRDAPLARQRMAFMFWPDSSEPQARSNLRNLLHVLIQALPDGERFIQSDNQTVIWRSDAPFTLDVDVLLSALANAGSAVDVQRALELHRGPLLPSCYDDWITPERERLEQKLADTLQGFVDQWERQGAYRDAIALAQQIVRGDPLREDLYRQIMRLYAASGDRAGVARTYKECRAALARELEVEPSRQTQEEYERCLRIETPGVRNAAAAPNPPALLLAPDPPPRPASLPVPNGAKGAAMTPRMSATALAPDTIRRAILADALQAPSTAIPLAIAAMALIYWLLFGPRAGWGGSFALAVLALAGLAAAVSFIWLYVIGFDRAYETKSHAALAQQQLVEQEHQQAGVEVLRSKLRDGFAAIAYTEGQYALKSLDYEYFELKAVLARQNARDPLAVAHLPALANETYLQGLSVLDDALELARSVSSPTNQRLEADLKDLEARIQTAKGKSGADEQIKLWRAKASSDRQRLDLIGQQRLRLQQLLQQADRCEGALQQTRIELASLKADASSVSVDAVLDTLQKTIDQAKAIQEEMRKLGY
jgi:DNA-binding SARP family transcriptional activator